jgi:hypothetical protein
MPRRISSRAKGTLILAATFLLLGGILFLRWHFAEPLRDAKTHCLPGQQQGQTVVFIDKTDLWNDNGSDRLVAHVLRLVQQRMRNEELLRVYIFGEKFSHGFEAAFTACKPPVEVPTNIIDSEAYRRRKFEEVFGGPLRKVMEEAKRPEEGLCSPIAEVTVEVLTRVEVKHWAGPTRLVYFSDMAQNTRIYSAFRGTRCFPANAQKDHTTDGRPLVQYFEQHRTMMSLDRVSAVIYQVLPERNPPRIKDIAKERWSEVFRALGIGAEWELL